jgi:hypothetical protein
MMLLQLAWHGLFEALACTASSSAHHLAAGVAINAGGVEREDPSEPFSEQNVEGTKANAARSHESEIPTRVLFTRAFRFKNTGLPGGATDIKCNLLFSLVGVIKVDVLLEVLVLKREFILYK